MTASTSMKIEELKLDKLIELLFTEKEKGSVDSVKNLLEEIIDTQINRRVNEEAEKYEECLKKLESDIRKHIQVISIVK
jgi:hypothetical protein